MRAVTIAVFVSLLILAVIVELFARRRPNQIMPVSEMLFEVSQSRITRLGIVAAWWWFGWHFFFAETVQLEV